MAYIGNAPAAGIVDSGNILNGAIKTEDLADAAVTAAKLAAAAVTDKLGYTPLDQQQLGGFSFRNLMINGDMRVAQRSTAPLTGLTGYNQRIADMHRTGGGNQATGRHAIYRKNSVDPSSSEYELGSSPAGFTHSLKYVVEVPEYASTSGPLFHSMFIEGHLLHGLNLGTANATPVTLSFWVKSSVVGLYEVQVHNNLDVMNHVGFTVNQANTWEKKTITMPAETTKAWKSGVDLGMRLDWVLKKDASSDTPAASNTWSTSTSGFLPNVVNWMGNAGATFYITGVQVEAGSVATPFERRPYGVELSLCHRYVYVLNSAMQDSNWGIGRWEGNLVYVQIVYPSVMRSLPSVGLTGDITGLKAVYPQVNWYQVNGINSVHQNGLKSMDLTFSTSEYGVPGKTFTQLASMGSSTARLIVSAEF